MADSGKLASFVFAGNTYSTASCIQSWNFNDAINDVIYQCNGLDKHALGTRAVSFRVSMGLDSTATTTVINLAPGTTGAWEGYPGGATAGNIKLTSTRGQIIARPIATGPNAIISMDLEIALDDITLTTAA